jgi:hypothetical protein
MKKTILDEVVTDSSHIMTQRCFMLCTTHTNVWSIICPMEVRFLTPLSKLFQLLLLWRKMEYPEKSTDLSQVTDKLLHLRSSIDRPLKPLPAYPCSNNYFSIPERKYIINNWGLMKKNYFGWSGTVKVFFWFHEVVNFLKNDGKMFKYSKRFDDVLIFEKQSLP